MTLYLHRAALCSVQSGISRIINYKYSEFSGWEIAGAKICKRKALLKFRVGSRNPVYAYFREIIIWLLMDTNYVGG